MKILLRSRIKRMMKRCLCMCNILVSKVMKEGKSDKNERQHGRETVANTKAVRLSCMVMTVLTAQAAVAISASRIE